MTSNVCLLAVLGALTGAARPDEPALVFHNVTVVDVEAGKLVPGRAVVVAGNTITAIAPAAGFAAPAGARVVDAAGKYLIPGLWDMHTHVAHDSYFPLFLANGVTGIRELHAFFPGRILLYRDEIAAGKRAGPRMVVAGAIIDGKPPIWPTSLTAATPDEGRAAVRKIKAMKADCVKVYESLTPEAYRAIVAEAKEQGLPVVGHCPQLVSAAEASDAGQRSIEHLTGIAVACSKDEGELRKELAAAMTGWKAYDFALTHRVWEKAWSSADRDKTKALFEAFVRNRTWQCPTLTIRRYGAMLDDPAFLADPRLKYMTPFATGSWKPRPGANATQKEVVARRKEEFAAHKATVRALHAAGVPLLAGTDCSNPYSFPGFSLHDELGLLVESGLTPAEALRTATLNPARFFGEEATAGTIAAGKRADLVLLDADPLSAVGNTKRIAGVVANGTYHDAAAMKKMLDDVEKQFASKK